MIVGALTAATLARSGLTAAAGVAMLLAVQRMRNATRPAPSPFETAARHRPGTAETRPPDLETLERVVGFAASQAGDVHYRLRPVLRGIAAHRLRVGPGIDLDGAPGRARQLLGDDLFDLVRADRPAPDDRFGPGMSPEALRALVDRLEGV